MKPSEERKIMRLEDDLQEYYNDWFNYWYSCDDWYDDGYDYSGYWDWYQENPTRIRQENIDKLLDINQNPTLKDIWPEK